VSFPDILPCGQKPVAYSLGAVAELSARSVDVLPFPDPRGEVPERSNGAVSKCVVPFQACATLARYHG
jgi:hypothetical protein